MYKRQSIARVKVLELPVNFMVFLLCALVMGLLISQTAFGLRVQMIGTNSRAARFSGLNCPLDLMRVYTISGMFAAVSGAISSPMTSAQSRNTIKFTGSSSTLTLSLIHI